MSDKIVKSISEVFDTDESYFENVKWVAYYNKYNEGHLCFKSDNWNVSVSNIVSKDLTGNKMINIVKLKQFYEWLGERLAILLNLSRGLTNDQLKDFASASDFKEQIDLINEERSQ